jgi:hypothetical protein
MIAVKQPNIELTLKRFNALRERRLGDAQSYRRS